MANVYESFAPNDGQTVDPSRFQVERNTYSLNDSQRNKTTSVELPNLTITGQEEPKQERADKPKSESTNPTEDKETAEAKRIAAAIDDACNGGLLGWGTDFEKIKDLLQDKTKEEIDRIDRIFQEQYGKNYASDGKTWGLKKEFEDEMSGATLDRALSLLKGIDGNNGGDAARIHAALIERGQTFFGKTDQSCEEEIRSKLSTMNSKEIEQLEKDYSRLFPGKELRSDLLNDPHLSDATKEAIQIYLKGTDNRHNNEDTRRLAEIALKHHDLKIFEEAFRDASSTVRKEYMTDANVNRIKDAFDQYTEDGTRLEGRETRIAKDFVEGGAISAITEVQENRTLIGDNEKAIEATLLNMTRDQRDLYLIGRELAQHNIEGDTDSDKAASRFYKDLHQQLTGAGNGTEVLKWEDMILHADRTLVSHLADFRGVFDDDEAGVCKSIENMSQEDWIRLKMEPGFRKSIDDILSTYLSASELKRADDLLDQKMAAPLDLAHLDESYLASKSTGNRSFEASLSDARSFWGADQNAVYDAISKMTPEEQKKYREDKEYRQSIDDTLKRYLLAEPQLDVATGMLDHVMHGETPKQGLLEKINLATLDGTGLAQVIRDIEQAFKEDPSLKERLHNPQTPEDQKLSKDFDTAIRRHTIIAGQYQEFIKPLLESKDGRLSLQTKVQLNRSVFDDNERGFFTDVLMATDEEKKRLQTDTAYYSKVLGALNEDEQDVADFLIKQGKMQPEDEIRACILGAGTDEAGIKSVLNSMSPTQIEELKESYATKYGTELLSDLHDELGSQDKVEMRRLLEKQPQNAREQFNRDQDRYFEARDGIGAAFVDTLWDGTGLSLDNVMNKYSKEIAECARRLQELPPEERKKLADQLNAATDLYVQSKGAAADALGDALLAIGAVAGAGFTGGASLGLLALVGASGAAIKVSTKALIMGDSYDWTSSDPLKDSLNGTANALANFAGAGQFQKLLGLGKYGSVAAAGFTGGFIGGATRESMEWDSRLSVGENLERILASGATSGVIGAGAGVLMTGAIDAVGASVRAIRGGLSEQADNVAAQLDDTARATADNAPAELSDFSPAESNRLSSEVGDVAAENSDNVGNQAANVAAENSDNVGNQAANVAAENSDNVGNQAANVAAENSDNVGNQAANVAAENSDNVGNQAANAIDAPQQPRKLTLAELDELYKQRAGQDGAGVVRFTKDPNLVYRLDQVNASDYPNGLFLSTKEGTIITGEITLADGTVIPKGTALPYGVQISPGSVEKVGDKLNKIVGGKIVVPGDGVTLPNGTILRTSDIADNTSFQIFDGQFAKAGTTENPGDWIVLRETTDGNRPIYDAYTNSNSTKLKNWNPIEGEPGMFNPAVKATDPPREMIKLEPDERFAIDTDKPFTAKEPSFLVRRPDGKYYFVSYKDVSETMVPVDARSEAVLASLKPSRLSNVADDISGNQVAAIAQDNADNITREGGRIMEVSNAQGSTKLGYDSNGQLNEVSFSGDRATVWKRQADGWVGYNNQGQIVEDRMLDIDFKVSPNGDVEMSNLGYLNKIVNRADGMTEYHLNNGGYRLLDTNNRVKEMGFEGGIVAKPIYEPGSDVISRLDLSDNSSIQINNGRLSITRPDGQTVVYPGRGEILAPGSSADSDAFAIKFGNRELKIDLDDDIASHLRTLNHNWSDVVVNADGSYQTPLDDHIKTFRDSSERLLKVEQDGNVSGTFKYSSETGRDLAEVDFAGPNGFKAQRVPGKENVWTITEGGRQYEFEGDIAVVSDPTSDVGISVRRVTSQPGGGELTELLSLDGKSATHFPDGSVIYKNADGLVTSAYSARHSASYVYSKDGSGLESVDLGRGRFTATRLSGNQWRIEGDAIDPYTFEGNLEVNQSGSLSRISPNGVRESFRLDGSRSIAYPDGSLVSVDAGGRVVAAESALTNSSARFEYIGNTLTKVNTPGMNARRVGADQWLLRTPDGSESIFKGKITVKENGEIWKALAGGEFERLQ